MRLICPKCAVNYEVADDAIPEGGRNVQCSNCGHSWYQAPLAHDEAPAEAPEIANKVEPEARAPGEDAGATRPQTSRRLDPVIAEILRDEADREARARKAETPDMIEGQSEMAFGPPKPKEEDAPEEADAAPDETLEDDLKDFAPRRELLPDIEEINSSLRAQGDAAGGPRMSAERREELRRHGRGFRLGLAVSVLLFTAVLIAYSFAPEIQRTIPASAGLIDRLVEGIDSVRIGMDRSMQAASRFLSDVLGDPGT